MTGDYYKTEASVKEYIKLAEEVNGAELIKRLRTFLHDNSIVLEIGSGPGTDFELLSNTYEVVGSDNSEEFLKHLKTSYNDGMFLNLDAISLKTDKKFDGIYSNKVMHHLKDDELAQSIKRQYQILNTNGIICHSFWKGEGSEVFKGLFVNYHNKTDLEMGFGVYFDILHLGTYTEFDKEDSLLLIAKKK